VGGWTYPSRKSYPRVTMMNLNSAAQRKKAHSISAKGLAKHTTMGTRAQNETPVCCRFNISQRGCDLALFGDSHSLLSNGLAKFDL
jgi:hypothetical protein